MINIKPLRGMVAGGVLGLLLVMGAHLPSALGATKPGMKISTISVKAELNKAFITIGDPVEYTVTIRHIPKIRILSTIPMPSQDIFKMQKINEFKREEDKMVVEGRRMTLTTFRLGEFILEPVKIQYQDENGATKSIETEKIFLTVKSVAQGETKKDIRGIKTVISIPFRYKKALIIFLALAMLVLVGGLIYRIVKKKRTGVAVPERILTSEEEALLHLDQLFDSDLLRRGKIKDYYLRLSAILRVYFERRYQILAVELTTYEIMKALKAKTTDMALREKIQEVLEAADLAKFAKWKPEPAQIVLINQKAKQVVEESRPKEEVAGDAV